MYGKALLYLLGTGAAGVVLLSIFQPSESEFKDLKTLPRPEYSAAIRAAASMKEPIYRQTSAQIQKKVEESLKQIQAEQAAAKRK